MKAFVTGGAGFIGSNIVDRLARDGHAITVYDNLSTGFRRHLDEAAKRGDFRFVQGDLLDAENLTAAMKGCDTVFHFAANADVRFGTLKPRRDLEQNTIGTFNVLEAMRANQVELIAFSSTGALYGDSPVIPTPEDAPFPVQTSLYGASKLACEGMISAYCEGFGMRAFIFRFVSILGERYSHGHVFDFYRKLRENPHRLDVLGDGEQKKSYLYVGDCVEAILTAMEKASSRVNIFNLGTDEYCEVRQSIRYISERLRIDPKLEYGGGKSGWAGDNPFLVLDSGRIRALGWKPKLSIRAGIVRTLEYLIENPWLLDSRH